ncbi:general stress protein [Priestia aryabhattai]|uniref:general stress protein n=1 Tax=Priestia aryabhattai TaxID=412384 RepID=UPI001C0E46BC|nr:general stress protein [Priestia aryabhattai]MBU3570065.1 general stress protein [Priestia aryabhattai]WDL87860.1 general stress protein [Priestia aryabhattai]
MKEIKVAENSGQANKLIEDLFTTGFSKSEVYLLAYNKERSEYLTDITNTKEYRTSEQGIFTSTVDKLFSRENELRSKMTSLGLTQEETERCIGEMKQERIVIIAKKSI